MLSQILLIIIGLSSGTIIAGGITGLLIGLAIIPRYAGITRTARYILFFEDICFLGITLGNILYLFKIRIPLGNPLIIIYGLFSGIFLGCWILALAEMADIFPIFARRIRFVRGLPAVILSIAVGKCLGSLFFYLY